MPGRFGELVLGGVWHSASELIVPITLGVAGAGLGTGAAAGLRALGAARRSLRCQLFASACYVSGGLGGRPRPARSARPGASPPRPSAARPCGGCNCGPPCASATAIPSPK